MHTRTHEQTIILKYYPKDRKDVGKTTAGVT